MKKMLAFASRNTKELLRDPISLAIGVGIPFVVLLIICSIQSNTPVEIFKIESFAPGIAVFSFAFISLFSGMLLARDRESSFLVRLFASPMNATGYILGYMLPLFVIALIQSIVCFGTAIVFGLELNIHILMTLVVLIPVAILCISVGLLLGSLFTDKQVGGVGSLLMQVAAFTSGMWFDLSLVGSGFYYVSACLPYYHALEMTKAALSGNYQGIFPHMWVVLVYAVILTVIATLLFKRKMNNGNT